MVTLGDSLTAEYDVIPDIPGFDDLPTDYARVTVTGWEAKSWVEIAAQLRGQYFNFGTWKDLSDPWVIPRLSGYEYNWGVPGVDAGQYEDFVTSSNFSNPFYFAARQPLEDQLSDTAERVVIWLGGNDFRGNYGPLYDGQDSTSFVNGLIDDLSKVIDFVKGQNSTAQIVIVNLPDLGATPSKRTAHPDPPSTKFRGAGVRLAPRPASLRSFCVQQNCLHRVLSAARSSSPKHCPADVFQSQQNQ